MKPSSFCTICTHATAYELVGLLLSLGVHHPNTKVYIMCDQLTKNMIKDITPNLHLQLQLHWFIELDDYSYYNRKKMEELGIFKEFLMNKAKIMKHALKKENDTLFLDNDIVLVNPIKDIKRTTNLGVSRQYLVRESLEETGYYNAGMLWTNSKNVCNDWITYTEKSRYFEQAAIENLVAKYNHFEFGEEYNVQCWRYYFNPVKEPFTNYFSSEPNGNVYYKKKPLRCIHTHFRDKRFVAFNNLILHHLANAKFFRCLIIIYRIIHGEWRIKIPTHQHQDSFRELAVMIGEANEDVMVKRTNDKHCWLEPNILLYDRPTLEWCDKQVIEASLFLLGNGDTEDEGKKILEKTQVPVLPWIFWPRTPHVVEHFIANNRIRHYNERCVESIFIGNIENNIQQLYREPIINQWQDVIQVFECFYGNKHKYTSLQYIEKIHMSKYGLCLRGYGSKCHREIELMAVGTVPIVTQDVTMESYLEPLCEGTHYFRVTSPPELKAIIEGTSPEQWCKMSNACIHWYMRNVHSKQAWETMITHILFQ
jgi:hypothetical protein